MVELNRLGLLTSSLVLLCTGSVVDGFVSPSYLKYGSVSLLQQGRQATTTSGSIASVGQRLQATSSSSPNDKKDTTTIGTLEVPTIGVGTISWSSEKFFGIENKALEPVVEAALQSKSGVLFDTAERYGSHAKTAFGMGYGETEKLTRVLLDRVGGASDEAANNRSPMIATKFTPTPWRTTAESVVEACMRSKERLGVEQIDLYQLHMPDIVQPFRMFGKDTSKDSIYWDGLAECYHRGLVKNVGVSNYGPTLVEQCQEALAKRGVPLASNQIAYSLVGRHNGAQATLDKCNELDIKVLASFPFAMGLLTGKYSSGMTRETWKSAPIDDADLALSLTKNKKTRLEELDLMRYAQGDGVKIPVGGISPLLERMERIADARGKTVAQVALNYIVCKGAIPIPGARTEAQVNDNLGAMGWRLTPAEVSSLEEAADLLGFGFEGAGFKRTSEKFVGYGIEKWALD